MNPADVLALRAADARAWMRAADVGQGPFNWHGLAFSAADRAIRDNDLDWAEIAVAVYDELARRADPAGAKAFTMSAMRLRAAMIERFGPKAGDDVRDLATVVRWFERVRGLSVGEATRLVRAGDRSVAVVRQLRDIKNALGVLALVSREDLRAAAPDIDRWLDLRPELP